MKKRTKEETNERRNEETKERRNEGTKKRRKEETNMRSKKKDVRLFSYSCIQAEARLFCIA
jgi:uncharacterized membrane-anchored protein